MTKYALLSVILYLLLLVSCNSKRPSKDEVTQQTRHRIYKGDLYISADEGLMSIIQQQIEIFEHHYDSVRCHIEYKNEANVIKDFREKKVEFILLSRTFTNNERELLRQNDNLFTRELPVAYDAVALIAHSGFDDSSLDIGKLKSYFQAEKLGGSPPLLVFESQKSATVGFVLDLVGLKIDDASKNVYALKSSEDVVDYVASNENAIGFIPFNLISESSNERVKAALKQIKILSLRTVSKEGEHIRVSANQSDIAAGDYPLIRSVTAITPLPQRDNLEALLFNFLYKEKGARVFLRAGLVPVNIPEREIIVNPSERKSRKQ